MGRIVTLGDTAANIQGSLQVLSAGMVRFFLSGVETGRLYVQQTAPASQPKQLVTEFNAADGLQQLPLSWIPTDLAAGLTLTFTLVPVMQGLEGPVLVTVVASPGMAVPQTPTGGSYTGKAWWAVPPGDTTADKGGAPPPAATLWDTLSHALSGFPGGAPAALGLGGVALVLVLKKKQG